MRFRTASRCLFSEKEDEKECGARRGKDRADQNEKNICATHDHPASQEQAEECQESRYDHSSGITHRNLPIIGLKIGGRIVLRPPVRAPLQKDFGSVVLIGSQRTRLFGAPPIEKKE